MKIKSAEKVISARFLDLFGRHDDILVEEPGFKNVKNKHLGMSPF